MECSWRWSVSQTVALKNSCSVQANIGSRPDTGRETTYIVLRQQTGAEFEVVVQVERTSSLETGTESGDSGSLSQLSHALDTPELALRVLRTHARAPPGAAAMVVRVGHHVRSSGVVVLLLVVLLLLVCVEKCRHYEGIYR